MPICREFYGSDGTRTRDLRRDRPCHRSCVFPDEGDGRPMVTGFAALPVECVRMAERRASRAFGACLGHAETALRSRRERRRGAGDRPAPLPCSAARLHAEPARCDRRPRSGRPAGATEADARRKPRALRRRMLAWASTRGAILTAAEQFQVSQLGRFRTGRSASLALVRSLAIPRRERQGERRPCTTRRAPEGSGERLPGRHRERGGRTSIQPGGTGRPARRDAGDSKRGTTRRRECRADSSSIADP